MAIETPLFRWNHPRTGILYEVSQVESKLNQGRVYFKTRKFLDGVEYAQILWKCHESLPVSLRCQCEDNFWRGSCEHTRRLNSFLAKKEISLERLWDRSQEETKEEQPDKKWSILSKFLSLLKRK